MSKITTADCKKFLADYFKNNADEIDKTYSDTFDSNNNRVVEFGSKPNKWTREWKSKPTGEGMNWWSTETGFWTTEGEKNI